MILKTEAIVLKSFDYRETSRIATFFSREHGKVSGIMKGIRADPRKFGSSVERFSVNAIVYYHYRNTDLHLISQCDCREFFPAVRQDLKRSLAASYMLELIHAVMPVEEENLRVYQLMLDFLRELEATADIGQLVRVFQIKMLSYSGFRPQLDACVKCRRQISGKAGLSVREGGLLCPQCLPLDPETHPISPGTVASILYVERSPWEKCRQLRLTAVGRKELKDILNNFLVFHLGRKIKSARYVRG